MKKFRKGQAGYLDYQKKAEIIRVIIYFAIILAIFLIGYFQTKTRLNVMTIVAVVGCLPACKVLVGVIIRVAYYSINKAKAAEIAALTDHITVIYDMIITSRQSIMPVDCIVISGHTAFGFTSSHKVDPTEVSKHISDILRSNQIDGVSLKILDNYTAFLARAEGLNNIARVEKSDTKAFETQVANLILNISL